MESIARESRQGALRVANSIFRTIERLETYPRSAPVDRIAPALPQPGARARRAVSGNYEIRYAFPVRYGGHDVVAILFVRDARRDVLEIHEVHDRFTELMLREIAGRSG